MELPISLSLWLCSSYKLTSFEENIMYVIIGMLQNCGLILNCLKLMIVDPDWYVCPEISPRGLVKFLLSVSYLFRMSWLLKLVSLKLLKNWLVVFMKGDSGSLRPSNI